ncbi:MAG TPA: hypothetical protein VN458_11570 [Solirubrobacterales bacterium]|nr:hypothetical protein [Solirubrobacterales bacterium]
MPRPHIKKRPTVVLGLATAAALGVGLVAFPGIAAAPPPPVVPSCTPQFSSASRSCVRLKVTGLQGPAGIQAGAENIRLGVRTRSTLIFPSASEVTSVVLRFDDDILLNLGGIPTCPASELTGKKIAQAWEQCGPGADGSPPSEGNAYLSTGLGPFVSGVASTTGAGTDACVMAFKGANNTQIVFYARFPIGNPDSECNNPAANMGGTGTVLFTGTLSHQPLASPYDWTLTVPNIQVAHPPLDDFYGTLTRATAFRARCPAGQDPHQIEGVVAYTNSGDPTDTISPPYTGTEDPCAAP